MTAACARAGQTACRGAPSYIDPRCNPIRRERRSRATPDTSRASPAKTRDSGRQRRPPRPGFFGLTLSVRCFARVSASLCWSLVLEEVCTHGFEGGVHPRFAGRAGHRLSPEYISRPNVRSEKAISRGVHLYFAHIIQYIIHNIPYVLQAARAARRKKYRSNPSLNAIFCRFLLARCVHSSLPFAPIHANNMDF